MKYTVFHGSRFNNLTKLSTVYSGTGIVGSPHCGCLFFTSDLENATFYADPKHEDDSYYDYTYEVELTMNCPLLIDDEYPNRECIKRKTPLKIALEAMDDGRWDGVIIRDIVDGQLPSDIYIVWNDEQIKILRRMNQCQHVLQA